jgi:hypothetical protein
MNHLKGYQGLMLCICLPILMAAQTSKKPVFSKASYQSQLIAQNTFNCQPDEVVLTAEATSYCKFSKTLLYTYQLDYNNDGTRS